MSFGMRCWDESWRLTFDTNIRTIRSTVVQMIPSGTTGSVLISSLPSGLEGVNFVPVNSGVSGNIVPYTWTDGVQLHWRQGAGDYYLEVMDIAGLGGTTDLDEDV